MPKLVVIRRQGPNLTERSDTMLHPLSTAAVIATCLTVTLTPMAASTQSVNCAPRDVVVERLASRYGETRQSMGLGPNNAVMEVFASPVTGSWTITVTTARGLTCLLASGQAFEPIQEALPNTDTGA